eukprot:scaffold2752_cov393-Prasinococcus_capsulatus_cf.AAC.1
MPKKKKRAKRKSEQRKARRQAACGSWRRRRQPSCGRDLGRPPPITVGRVPWWHGLPSAPPWACSLERGAAGAGPRARASLPGARAGDRPPAHARTHALQCTWPEKERHPTRAARAGRRRRANPCPRHSRTSLCLYICAATAPCIPPCSCE